MKVFGLDGQEYSMPLSNKTSRVKNSKLHIRARKIITELYPFDIIIEEVTLPGTKTTTRKSLLFADFFVAKARLVVEVQGEQHYKYVSHFHNNKLEFFKSQARDRDKQEWCEINGFKLVELPYMETDDEWRRRIEG